MRVVDLHSDLVRSAGDLADDCVAHGWSAGHYLDRGEVEIRGSIQVVLSPGVLRGGHTHPLAQQVVPGQALEDLCERGDLELVHRYFRRHRVRELREPARIAD